jgi:uncharacterized protein
MNDQSPDAGDASLAVRLLILNVSTRCNLNCSYCYVYNQGDETWRSQPRVMSRETVRTVLARVRAHAVRHQLPAFTFSFHGGEALLCGEEFFVDFVREAERILRPEVHPLYTLQTNGTLLTPAWCKLLDGLGISVGISLDGPPEVNDRYRKDHAGRGSYAAVSRGIEVARSFPWTNAWGVLSVIDPASDPLRCYEHLKELGVERVDFLLPDSTHDRPPDRPGGSPTAYADWLITIFERWFDEQPNRMRIRIFDGLIGQVLGRPGTIQALGSQKVELLFIDADGSIEGAPSLKVCGHGFTKLGLNVQTHELDEALGSEQIRAFHLRSEAVSSTCAGCQLKRICGGGHLPNRYSRDNAFDNPSVFCADLAKLITHIQTRVRQALPPALRSRLGIEVADPVAIAAHVSNRRRPRRNLPLLQDGAP